MHHPLETDKYDSIIDEPQLSYQGENLGDLQTLILMVHSHLMLSQC
jgi:hypothetical protein